MTTNWPNAMSHLLLVDELREMNAYENIRYLSVMGGGTSKL